MWQVTRHVSDSRNAPPTRPYSPAVVADGWVYVSGHVPVDGEGALVGETASAQATQVLKNLESTLEAAGISRQDLVATTVYLTQMSDTDEIDTAYRDFFGDGPYPTRTTVGIAALGRTEFRIEISAIGRAQDVGDGA